MRLNCESISLVHFTVRPLSLYWLACFWCVCVCILEVVLYVLCAFLISIFHLWLFPFESEVAQSCPTLYNPMDGSPPGSSHGLFQARRLEWVAISFSRGSSPLRDWTQVSCMAGRLYHVSHQGILWSFCSPLRPLFSPLIYSLSTEETCSSSSSSSILPITSLLSHLHLAPNSSW